MLSSSVFSVLYELISLDVELEVCLRMCAGGADYGSLVAYVDVTAVAADPDHLGIAGEYLLLLDVGQQSKVTLLVVLLNGGNAVKQECDVVKAFLAGDLGEFLVHLGPLVILTLGGCLQVLSGGAEESQLLEPQLCMLLLVLCSLGKECGDLLIAFLLGLACKIGILVSCFGFAGKCSQQIGFGSASLQFGHDNFSFQSLGYRHAYYKL